MLTYIRPRLHAYRNQSADFQCKIPNFSNIFYMSDILTWNSMGSLPTPSKIFLLYQVFIQAVLLMSVF